MLSLPEIFDVRWLVAQQDAVFGDEQASPTINALRTPTKPGSAVQRRHFISSVAAYSFFFLLCILERNYASWIKTELHYTHICLPPTLQILQVPPPATKQEAQRHQKKRFEMVGNVISMGKEKLKALQSKRC